MSTPMFSPPVDGGRVNVMTPGWVPVSFVAQFLATPGVSVATSASSAAGPTKRYSAPSITLRRGVASATSMPRITLNRWPGVSSLTLPKVVLNFRDTTYDQIRARAVEGLGDWGLFNWARDLAANGIAFVVYWVWVNLVKPQVDDIRNSISKAISDLRDSTQNGLNDLSSKINSALDNVRSGVQATLDQYRDSANAAIASSIASVNDAADARTREAQEAFRSVTAYAQASFNDLVPSMYTAFGIPAGTRLAWVTVRNVTTSGFEFYAQAPGDYYWIAAGRTGSGLRGLLRR